MHAAIAAIAAIDVPCDQLTRRGGIENLRGGSSKMVCFKTLISKLSFENIIADGGVKPRHNSHVSDDVGNITTVQYQ